jgi:hypothetical protein
MKRILIVLFAGLAVFAIAAKSWAQAPASAQVTSVPPLVQFSGTLKDAAARPVSGLVSVTFAIYGEQEGGTALWSETQNITADASGHYSATLGIATGLPDDLFAAAQSRWLGVRIAGQAELPRVLLVSVPYALKAADADTLGGLPASAFLLAAGNAAGAASSVTPATASQTAATGVTSDVTPTGSGTAGYLPLWTTASNLGNSGLFQSSSGFIGVNTATPAVTLDVAGNMYIRGGFTMPPEGTATATTGYSSHSYYFSASAYNSSSKTAEDQTFAWEAEPLNNNTASPSATLKLRFAEGTGSSVATGFQIGSNGILSFASGQTFPGTGSITDVSAGSGLVGGGTTGTVTVNVDSTKVPLLANTNTFSATQTITNGDLNLPATTGANVGVLNIGGVPFLHGYNGSASYNVFIGGAGNFTNTASGNLALGLNALQSLTTGNQNIALGYEAMNSSTTAAADTAVGIGALEYNTMGQEDTAVGYGALNSNTTGYYNTAIGIESGVPSGSGGLYNTTAVGAFATVNQGNTLILGNTTSSPGAQYVNVGIGTATPRSIFEAVVEAPETLGPAITLTNSGGESGAATAIDFNSYYPSSSGTYNPAARIEAVDANNNSDDIVFFSNIPSSKNNGLQRNMIVGSTGEVGINLPAGEEPSDYYVQLSVVSGFSSGISGIYSQASPNSGGNNTYGVRGIGGDITDGTMAGSGGAFQGGVNNSSSGGTPGDGIDVNAGSGTASASVYAGNFGGDVNIAGTLSATTKHFKIDDPLDPANKYLVHASVESSEMMNIYTGNVVTDANGLATVALPNWFESLNTDFRYQLTIVGRKAQAWISQEVQNGKFSISTDTPQVKVSWQITAVRQDAYAKAHPMIVEQEKPANELGYYIHPELYGQPRQKQTEWGRHPGLMQRMDAQSELVRKESAARTAADGVKSAASQPASAVNRTFVHPAVPVRRPAAPAKPAAAKPVAAVKP